MSTAAGPSTFDDENDRRYRAPGCPDGHDHFELSVAERRRPVTIALAAVRFYLVHLFERGRRYVSCGHPAHPVVDKAALENPLDDQVGRLDVRRVLDEPEPDVQLIHAGPGRPQVVQYGRRHVFRLHEVLLVQTFGQRGVLAAFQPTHPVVYVAFRHEILHERPVDRILRG